MADDDQMEFAKKQLGEMREFFGRGDWEGTISAYEQIAEIKTDRATRLEAACLAARALVASRERPAARQLLKSVVKLGYKKPVHYEFLARAYLDLKQYKEAASACERAEELRAADQTPT